MRRRKFVAVCSSALLAVLLAVSLSCGEEEPGGREVPFSELDKGDFTYYSFEETGAQNSPAFFELVVDQAGWEEFWAQMYPPSYVQGSPPPPEVDLGSEIVIAAFQGVKPTGGYAIEVTGIEEDSGTVDVYVDTVAPLPGSMITQAFTSPYDIVTVSRADLGLTGEVKFDFWDNSGRHLAVEYAGL